MPTIKPIKLRCLAWLGLRFIDNTADDTALPLALSYPADSNDIQSTWVEDVKVGEHMAFFGVSGSGWSNDGLGLAWLQ
jgi:hypothetical protein